MIADIALPIPVGKNFSYSVPDTLIPFLSLWSRVTVPFHNREMTGIVIKIHDGENSGLKPVRDVIDLFPLVGGELPELLNWSSSFYLAPIGLVLKYALNASRDIDKFLAVELHNDLSNFNGLTLRKMSRKMGMQRIHDLYRQKALDVRDTITGMPFGPLSQTSRKSQDGQRSIFIDSIEKRFELYLTKIDDHLRSDANILFLLPDYYAAGAWFTKRLVEVYGSRVLWFGAGIPVKKRMETYFKVRSSGGHIILGNKSSVFLPIHDLNLVIAERFDDDEYRNEESFKYNAVGIAAERARLCNIPVILGSAACSTEILRYGEQNGFTIDVREWLSTNGYPERITSVYSRSSGEFLDRAWTEVDPAKGRSGSTAAIYTPRKDYGSFIRCDTCKETVMCTKCSVAMSYDHDTDNVYCPECSTRFPYTDNCPNCGSGMLTFSRIGAMFIQNHISRIFPETEIIPVTGDSLKKELSVIRKPRHDRGMILVGTQALSKLYECHVGKLVLFGWNELRKMGGYRAEEKTHQVIAHLIDSLTPDEIICRSGKDILSYLSIADFYARELKKRREADFPPFSRVFLIEIKAKTITAADRSLKKVRSEMAAKGLESHMFGMIAADKHPFYIRRIILKGEKNLLTDSFHDLYNIPGIEIEADPLNF